MKEASSDSYFTRRKFLKGAGYIAISFPLLNNWHFTTGEKAIADTLPGSLNRQPKISAWLEILADGRIRVLTGKMELGQGIRTAIAQVAADELDMDLDHIEVHLAETGRTPHEGYTAGSGSIENSAMSVRYAAAAARQKLLELAAKKLNKQPEQLTLTNGRVLVKTGKQSLTFADILNGAQIEDEVRLPVTLKPKKDYRWVGKAIPREDIAHMVRGQAGYIHDLRFPGMVHARIIRPTAYQAKLLSMNEAQVKKAFPGIVIVRNGDFLGVITTDEYEAVKAQAFLKQHTKWSVTSKLPANELLHDYIKKAPVHTERIQDKGNVAALKNAASKSLQATYFKPYHMHGSIGPSCAVAMYEKDTLHIWSHSQGVYPLRDALAKLLNLDIDRIHITGVPGSGCYGHNGADDVAAEAALLAMASPGKHVRLQWSREDEHAWEPYGSAMQIVIEAGLDAHGKINYWNSDVWSDGHSTRPGGDPAKLLPARYLAKSLQIPVSNRIGGGSRNSEPYYTIPAIAIQAHAFNGPLRVSALRSLGAYANIFAIESFMDELADKAGKDPLQFRLAHLEDERGKAIIDKIRELTNNQKLAVDEGLGFAYSRYKNSAAHCAVAAKVKVDKKSGQVQVLHLWAAIDAGETINLDGVINQTEGGMIQAASWTLLEEVRFDEQHTSSRDWASYPIFRFSNIPEVKVAVINRPEEEPLGAGEAAQGPTAAALANAIYRASGKRIRNLPIRPEKITG